MVTLKTYVGPRHHGCERRKPVGQQSYFVFEAVVDLELHQQDALADV